MEKKKNKINQTAFSLYIQFFRFIFFLSLFTYQTVYFTYASTHKDTSLLKGSTYEISLDKTGVITPLRLVGNKASATVSIPVNPNLKVKNITFQFVPSPNLTAGELWASHNGVVIATTKISPHSSRWTIPLSHLIPRNRTLVFSIHMVLQNSNLCTAMVGDWLQIGPSGSVEYTEIKNLEKLPISEFFPPILNNVQIFFPNDTLTTPQIQAVLNLSAYIGRKYRSSTPLIELFFTPLPKRSKPMESLIWIGGEKTAVTNLPEGGYLLSLGPSPYEASQALFEVPFGVNAAITTQATNWGSNILEPSEIGANRTILADLGYPTEQVTGSGRMEITYDFSQADFGFPIHNLALRFTGHHTPVPQNANGNIQVCFNRTLIYSQELKGTTYHFYTKVHNHLLQRDNKLQIVFSYTPPGDPCSQGALPLTANVDSTSFLEYDFGNILPEGFDQFPTRFASGFHVAFDHDNKENLMQAANIIQHLQATTRHPLYPRFTTKLRTPYLYVGSQTPPNARVATHSFKIMNNQGQILLQFTPSEPFAVLEANNQKLILAGPSHLRQILLGKTIFEKNGWYNLTGDTVLIGSTEIPSNIDIHGHKLIVEELSAFKTNFFDQYRILFFSVVGIILLLIFIWLYPRVIHKPPEGE